MEKIRNKLGRFTKGHKVSQTIRNKIGKANKNHFSHRKNKTLEEEYGIDNAKKIREKMRNSHLGKRPNNYGQKMPKYSGKNHWNWQGGITKLNWQIRASLEYKIWQRKVLAKDNWTCQDCGKRGNGRLHAHHKKDFSKILKQYHIETLKQALSCKELWDPNNGKTLCVPCHKKTDTYANNLRYATVRSYGNKIVRSKQK